MNLIDLASSLIKIVDFNYITADDYGVKMWRDKPKYHSITRSWGGKSSESWLGAIADEALPDISVSSDSSKNIVDIRIDLRR